MAIINKNQIGLFYTIRKKFVKATGTNPLKPNSQANAFPLLETGIYKLWQRYGYITNWRCVLYTPTNPQTPAQQANRAVFAAAVLAYQNLTTEQKLIYHKKARGKHMSGYNVFMKEYLNTH